jgi:hypothetical protein
MKLKNKNYLKIIFFTILFLALFFISNHTLAQDVKIEDYLFFSFKNLGDSVAIGIEGYIIANGVKYPTSKLSYRWKIDFGDNYEKVETFKPFLVYPVDTNFSGLVTIYIPELDHSFEKYFYYINKKLPSVSILEYDKKRNVVFPITKNSKPSFLYPFVQNFSSNRISYVWTINDKQYYKSPILDISDLKEGVFNIKITVINLDNETEFAKDEINLSL